MTFALRLPSFIQGLLAFYRQAQPMYLSSTCKGPVVILYQPARSKCVYVLFGPAELCSCQNPKPYSEDQGSKVISARIRRRSKKTVSTVSIT